MGETWEKFPELKFLALKRMYKYMVGNQCIMCLPCYYHPVLEPSKWSEVKKSMQDLVSSDPEQ